MYTMDIFRTADLQERKDAMDEALASARGKEADKQEQDKKDEEYNEKLQGVTDPIAQELLRKPIEDLAKKAFGKVSGAIRSRVAGGIRTAGRQVGDRLQAQASRLGVNGDDLEALRSGNPSRIGSRLLTRTQGRATSAIPSGEVDDDTRSVLNIGRRLRGGTARPAQPTGTDGEPVEVDAFSGDPVIRQTEAPRPQPIGEADDWTTQLYDSPITHTSELPARIPTTARPSLAFDSPEDPTQRFVSSRLNKIFSSTDLSDLPTPSFRPAPRVQPPSTAGDAQVLDQLAPMREAGRIQGSGISQRQALQNRQVLEDFKNASPDLTEGRTTVQARVQADAISGPATPQQPLVQGQAPEPDVQPESSAPAPREEPPSGTDGSSVEAPSIRQAGQGAEQSLQRSAGRSAGEVGEDALRSFAESEGALGGPEDPLADVVGLVAGLGTLFGGLFGGHHTDAISSDATSNAVAQQGVY